MHVLSMKRQSVKKNMILPQAPHFQVHWLTVVRGLLCLSDCSLLHCALLHDHRQRVLVDGLGAGQQSEWGAGPAARLHQAQWWHMQLVPGRAASWEGLAWPVWPLRAKVTPSFTHAPPISQARHTAWLSILQCLYIWYFMLWSSQLSGFRDLCSRCSGSVHLATVMNVSQREPIRRQMFIENTHRPWGQGLMAPLVFARFLHVIYIYMATVWCIPLVFSNLL